MALRIMVVDDEPLTFTWLKQALEEAGYEVRLFSDPRKALKSFQSGKFDLVVTDLQMTGIDGIELAKEIWKIRSDVPILLMTGGSMTEEEVRLHGFSGFLKKPVQSETLVRMVEELFPSTS